MNRTPPPLSVATRAELFAHLAAMEQSGLPADKAFSLLRLPRAEQARVDATRKLIARGIDPATAGRRGGLFGELDASCVRAALAAGSPAATYRRLADLYAERVALAGSVKSAMAVPLFTFVLALLLRPLPALVAGTLTTGGYLLQCVGPLLAAIGIYRLGKRLPHWLAGGAPPALRRLVEQALLRLPLVGGMTLRGNLRDFTQHLAILLEAGLPMFDALPLAEATVGNGVVRAECARIKPAMLAGATLTQALAALPAIGGDQLLACVRSGEHSGCPPEMLFRHAASETAAFSQLQRQAATWLPRAFYALLLLWIGWGVLSSGAFMPHAGEQP
ncbi:MAG: type II secretion system F family protein [Sterolibacteriaceae bacterium]|nr:type II secretion system F family protein [Candidatus Methylophosphatis haderslevensis]